MHTRKKYLVCIYDVYWLISVIYYFNVVIEIKGNLKMAYEDYNQSVQSLGKILYQLSKIGVPLRIVEEVRLSQSNTIMYGNILFAFYKWSENNTPIFKFSSPYDSYNKLHQPNYVILFGLDNQGNYNEVGLFENFNGLIFKEKVQGYSKTYLANFDGVPLREQILNPTTIEDKLNRLKNKFSK